MQDQQDRRFEMEIEIAAARAVVWQALTDAREIARWFAPIAEVQTGVGGHVHWQWGDQHLWRNTIELFEPATHLRLRYDSPVDDGRGGRLPLFIEFLLEGEGGTTRLRLVHWGFGADAAFDGEYDGIRGGWPVELRSLRLYLEHHRGKDRQLAWATRRTQITPDAAWQRLVGPDGLAAPRLTRLREGDPFTVRVDGAGSISGLALFVPGPHEFSGAALNVNRGWFRVHCGSWNGATNVWLWLAGYDEIEDRMREFQRAFAGLLDRCIGRGDAAAAGAGA